MGMVNRHFIRIFWYAYLMCLFFQAVYAEAKVTKPNILMILTDDLGYADVGFNGAKDIKTPNLDVLAQNGVTFTSAYVAHPFCGPSRAGLFTGRYPHKIGSQYNLPTVKGAGGIGVPVEETYFSRVLQDSGYFTGAVGKWHLGEARQYHPNSRGFDEFFGFLNGGHDYFPDQSSKRYAALVEAGRTNIYGYIAPLEYNGSPVQETEYLTDALSREAVKFIDKAKASTQPWFLYLAYNAPHTPLQAKEEDLAVFPHIQDAKRRTYAAMVLAVDRGVARIVDHLKKTHQFENTLIIFFSDNGGRLDQGASNSPLSEGKGSVMEGGYRTPMFIHWAEGLERGQSYRHPVHALDFYPTLTNLAGGQVPEGKQLDGKDILPAILSGESARPGESIFVMRHRKGLSDVAARRDRWKAVRVANGAWRLFDVEEDPGETTDLSEQYPKLLADLVADMDAWSWSHEHPRWFHIQKEGFDWREDNMPRFHETFELPTGSLD